MHLVDVGVVVEQYRLLEGMLKLVQEINVDKRVGLCNPVTCPQMMAAKFVNKGCDPDAVY